MKSFRSIGLALLVLAACICDVAYAIAEPLLRYISIGYETMACGVEKLKRELAQVFRQDEQRATGVGCGLDRESNGFRQSSAANIGAEERMALAI